MSFRQSRGSYYDPSINGKYSNFDPNIKANYNNATGSSGIVPGAQVVDAKPGQKMQINLTLNNPTALTLDFELFNLLNSFTTYRKQEYAQGNYQYIPLLTSNGIAAYIAGTGGTVGFDQNGNAYIQGDLAPLDPIATIGCSEIPYISLLTASGISAFTVSYIRLTVSSDPQIDQTITWFRKTMAGGVQENRISPRAYFRPNQFQNLTIDVTVDFTIGVDSGLKTKLLPGERTVLALFIDAWTNQTIN